MSKTNASSNRRLTIERAAIAAAERWVEKLRSELLAEHRAAAGGWPGTLSEARNCTRGHVSEHLAKLGSAPASVEELEFAARTGYAHARARWLASGRSAKGSPDDDPD